MRKKYMIISAAVLATLLVATTGAVAQQEAVVVVKEIEITEEDPCGGLRCTLYCPCGYADPCGCSCAPCDDSQLLSGDAQEVDVPIILSSDDDKNGNLASQESEKADVELVSVDPEDDGSGLDETESKDADGPITIDPDEPGLDGPEEGKELPLIIPPDDDDNLDSEESQGADNNPFVTFLEQYPILHQLLQVFLRL